MILLPQKVLSVCSKLFNVSIATIRAKVRTKHVSIVRHLAMWLCVTYTMHSLPELGTIFNRDHTSVLHAFNRVEDLLYKYSYTPDGVTLRGWVIVAKRKLGILTPAESSAETAELRMVRR